MNGSKKRADIMSADDISNNEAAYVWLTQSSAQISDYTELLGKLGYQHIHIPLLTAQELACDLPRSAQSYQAIMLSSANAAHALQSLDDSFVSLPVYTAGDQTAEAARNCGFDNVVSAGADLAQLEKIMAANLKSEDGDILYLSGQDISRIPEMHGFRIDRHICYKAEFLEDLPAAITDLIAQDKLAAITIFSGRAASCLSGLLQRHVHALQPDCKLAMIKALCLSDKVVNSIDALPLKAVRVADTPDRYGMLNVIKSELEIS